MKNTTSIVFILLLFSAHLLSAQQTLVLNRDECRQMAIENSETLKIADENINMAQGEKMAAKAARLPHISLSGTGLYSKQEISEDLLLPTQAFDPATGELVPNVAIDPASGQPIIGPDGNPVFNLYGFLPLDITMYGTALANLAAQQPIYTGGKINAGNKMANIGENMAGKNKMLQQAELIYATDQAYYQYLSVKEKVALAEEYKKLLTRLAAVVEDSYETGMINRNELLKVQVKYNEAALQAQKAQTGLALSQMALCRIIGVDLNTQLQITDSIANVSINLDTLNNLRAGNRIEYQLMQSQVEMAEQNIKMVRGDYLPTVGVSVGYNYLVMGLKDMDNYDQHGINALASINIPIVTFGERKGKIKSAKAEFNTKQLELQQATNYLQLEIEQARLNYTDAWTRVEMARIALEQASENMRISDDNYEVGMETIVNVLEAKAEWQKAYSNKIDALTNFKIHESNLLRVSNRLQP
ncbi:MAG: TolC family protein [Bacteroidales bacterium]|jgi:outer membrane protein TolC|nr:TolC family protein [Bacteroidales bacterium]MDD3130610.1 TolC family protein [Bacteroidales bacterium]MDY0333446.1 TolC family protein [Bacteroidales bacterium]NLO50548.1 TolC family protein [Bacteroidales bacterium]